MLLGLLTAFIELSFSDMQRSGMELTEAVVVRFSPFWAAWTGMNVDSRKSKRSLDRRPERSRSMYRLGSSVSMSGQGILVIVFLFFVDLVNGRVYGYFVRSLKKMCSFSFKCAHFIRDTSVNEYGGFEQFKSEEDVREIRIAAVIDSFSLYKKDFLNSLLRLIKTRF